MQIESLHGSLLIISILFSLHIYRNNCFVLCQSGLCKFTKFYSKVHCLLSSAGGQKKPTWPFLHRFGKNGCKTGSLHIFILYVFVKFDLCWGQLMSVNWLKNSPAAQAFVIIIEWGSSYHGAANCSSKEAGVVQECTSGYWCSCLV